MTCPVGAAFAHLAFASPSDGPAGSPSMPYPVANPGKYVSIELSIEEPFSVWNCRSEDNCPGGAPGSCGPHLTGRACDLCEDGYRWTEDGCEKCANSDVSTFLFPFLPILLVPLIICCMYKLFGDGFEKWESWQNAISCIVFITLNHYQLASLAANCNVELPRDYASTLDAASWTNDMVSIFKPACAGLGGFQANLAAKALIPIFVVFMAGVCKGVSALIAKLSSQGYMDMERNRLLNVVGSLMFTFFNAIVNLSLLLFK
jgi:hypothetical protein